MRDGGAGVVDRRTVLAASIATLTRPSFAAEGQTAASSDAFMRRAFEMKSLAVASGDQPYGAVVVASGRIIGESPSKVVTARDITAHAEMSAIRDAASKGETLSGATLYSTSIPCAMCQAAAARAGITRMIHGAELRDAGAPRGP